MVVLAPPIAPPDPSASLRPAITAIVPLPRRTGCPERTAEPSRAKAGGCPLPIRSVRRRSGWRDRTPSRPQGGGANARPRLPRPGVADKIFDISPRSAGHVAGENRITSAICCDWPWRWRYHVRLNLWERLHGNRIILWRALSDDCPRNGGLIGSCGLLGRCLTS